MYFSIQCITDEHRCTNNDSVTLDLSNCSDIINSGIGYKNKLNMKEKLSDSSQTSLIFLLVFWWEVTGEHKSFLATSQMATSSAAAKSIPVGP